MPGRFSPGLISSTHGNGMAADIQWGHAEALGRGRGVQEGIEAPPLTCDGDEQLPGRNVRFLHQELPGFRCFRAVFLCGF